jgi:hypothetical protein
MRSEPLALGSCRCESRSEKRAKTRTTPAERESCRLAAGSRLLYPRGSWVGFVATQPHPGSHRRSALACLAANLSPAMTV